MAGSFVIVDFGDYAINQSLVIVVLLARGPKKSPLRSFGVLDISLIEWLKTGL